MPRIHRRDKCIYIVVIIKEILARVLFADVRFSEPANYYNYDIHDSHAVSKRFHCDSEYIFADELFCLRKNVFSKIYLFFQ